MTFIIASVQFILAFTWMLIMMFAAFELALYLLSFALELLDSVKSEGWKALWHNPLRALKEAHTCGVRTLRAQSFRMV